VRIWRIGDCGAILLLFISFIYIYIYIYIYACFEQIIEFGLFKIDPNYLDAYIILYEL
jgi:hypothetical protein